MAFFTPIADLLHGGETAHRIADQAALLLRLRQTAAQAIPDALGRSVSIANYKQGKVVIFAENNAIAAKLRLFEPALTAAWARQGIQVSAVRVEVQPGKGGSAGRIKQARLSPAAERALGELERSLPAESPLRDAVAGLAGHGRKTR